MNSNETGTKKNDFFSDKQRSRRDILKKALVGTGAVTALHALPTKWIAPKIDFFVLPAHAQTSPVEENQQQENQQQEESSCDELIFRMKNESNVDITVTCELLGLSGDLMRQGAAIQRRLPKPVSGPYFYSGLSTSTTIGFAEKVEFTLCDGTTHQLNKTKRCLLGINTTFAGEASEFDNVYMYTVRWTNQCEKNGEVGNG